MDNAVFDAVLYVAAQYAGKPELDLYDNADGDFVPSKKFERKMTRFFKEIRRQERRKERKTVTVHLKRAAVALLLVCTVSFCGILSIQAVREAIWGTIVEWFDQYVAVSFVGREDSVAPTEILEYREPRKYLDEYERYEIGRTFASFVTEYEKEDICITYSQNILGTSPYLISNDDAVIHTTTVNGHPADYFEHNQFYISLVWSDGEYQYMLSGNLSIDDLQLIAESVE